MSKKLITIVSLVLTLVFIASFILIFNQINKSMSQANNEFSQQRNTLIKSKLDRFDDKLITGAEVIDAINNFRETPDGIKMSYYANFGIMDDSKEAESFGYGNIVYYDYDVPWYKVRTPLSYDTYKTYSLRLNNKCIIVPDKKYHSKIVTSSSGVVIGVVFTEE